MGNLRVKKLMLEVVENQLRENDPLVTKQVYEKLVDAGYSIGEAKEKIAAVVLTEIYNVTKEKQAYNEKRYTKALEEMVQNCMDYEDDRTIPTEWNEWEGLAEQGYEMQYTQNEGIMLDCWGKAWEIFQQIMEQEDEKKSITGLMEEQDYQYPIDAWLQDFELELGNAKQHEKRIEFCNAVLEMFDWSFDDNSNFLAAIGEALYEQGKVEEGREWFEKWLKKEPNNENAWSVFSWCVQNQDGAEKAYQLIRSKVIDIPCTMSNQLLFERAKYLANQLQIVNDLKWIETQLNIFYESLKKADDYNDFYDDFRMPVQQPLLKEKKVYPNDQCPCGSGKKYKKCCGRK